MEKAILAAPLGDAFDGPLSSYRCRRLTILFLLACYWFVTSDVFVDIFAGHDPSLSKCTCEGASFSISAATFNSSAACDSCEAMDGVLSCPADADITSMAIDMGLQCDSVALALTSSFDMIGVGFGSIFGGFFSDRFGRRRVYIIFLMCGTIVYFLTSYASSIYLYLFLKMCMGFCNASANMAAFTLASEIVGSKLRTPLTVELWAYLFAIMEVYCAVVAYMMRFNSWQSYVRVMALPFLILSLVSFATIPESPMWLQRKGQARRLLTTLRELLPTRGFAERLQLSDEHKDGGAATPPGAASEGGDDDGGNGGGGGDSGAVRVRGAPPADDDNLTARATIKLLCSSPPKTRLLLTQMYAWAAVSFAYYGLSFKSSTLSDDPYANFALSGVMEIPATFVCARVMDHPKLGRRTSYILTMSLIALSLVIGASWDAGAVPLFMVGKFGATGAFNLIYVQTVELFPTSVRNTALGMCSAFGRVGSISAPPLARAFGATVCMLIFSITSLVGAFLCYLNVPETLGKNLTAKEGDDEGVELSTYGPAPPASSSGATGKREAAVLVDQRAEVV